MVLTSGNYCGIMEQHKKEEEDKPMEELDYTMESNYALYRSQLKKMNKDADEREIYANWHELALGGWKVQQNPIRGYDGSYHFLYVSVRDDGKIYVGKHSTEDLSDGYAGSGIDVGKSIKDGHTFKTTILEFFRNGNAAYDEEHKVVNNRFLNESIDLVLNRGLGGKDYQPATINTCPSASAKSASTQSASTPGTTKSGHGKPRYYTFPMLGLKAGDTLTFMTDDNITCTVKDSMNVTHCGKTYSLNSLAKKFGARGYRNSLDLWKFNGKFLSAIRDEKYF